MSSKSTLLLTLAILITAFWLLFSTTAAAITLAELQTASKLRIKTWLEPDQGIIVGQQIKLQIEVATDKSFSGGTRIGHFEIEDAIVLQRENFALNSIREEGEMTWTVQQWTLVVYPQRSGSFEIPPVPLTLSILGEDFQPINGRTRSPPLTFSARQPEALMGRKGWVATNRFSVEEQFSKAMDELKPGDALVRTIRMSADNLPAMMLPPVSTDTIPGIAAYAKPAQLNDKVNRGDYLAERSQQITYIFEKPGDFLLPEQVFYWWNLETAAVETIVLPAYDLIVTGLPGQTDNDNKTAVEADPGDSLMAMLPMFSTVALIGILLLVVLWLTRKWLAGRSSGKANTIEVPTRRWLLKQAQLACRTNNDARALDYLYQWLGHYGHYRPDVIAMQVAALGNAELKLTYDRVMRALYAEENGSSSDTWRFIEAFTAAMTKQQKKHSPLQWKVDLKLN